MKKKILTILLFITQITVSQDYRIEQIRNNIEAVITEAPGLSQKVNINIKESSLASFLIAVSEVHKVNISIDPSLKQIPIANNFTDVTVGDLLVFLCKEYNLSIDFIGNILSIKPYEKPQEVQPVKNIEVQYQSTDDLLSLNLQNDKLYDAFKVIMDNSGKNLVFSPGLENVPLTAYIKNMPFDAAINKMAFANDLIVTKTRDNFYLFEKEGNENGMTQLEGASSINRENRPQRSRKSNFFFIIIDLENKILDVDFENTPISSIIYDIGHELQLDMFISSPLENAGNATIKAKNITFNELLNKIFEGSENSISKSGFNGDNNNAKSEQFSYKQTDKFYFFGTKDQLAIRQIKSIPLMHRSIELLDDPTKEGRSVGRLNNMQSFTNYNYSSSDNTNRGGSTFQQQSGQSAQGLASESILKIIPEEIRKDIDIKVDKELNSFIVNGPAANIERFESFIKYIDKAVPVILIEVMLLEVSRSAIIETGISAGIGDKKVTTSGTVFPVADMTLGAQTINKIINRFDGFGSLNIGSVIPEFYLNIKAMEANGDLKIRSSPRLSTLNGHRAYLSIGETTYYVVTNQNFYGSQIPQTSEIKNYQPIDAELSITIKPLVSGDGQITMDIKVIQSSFNDNRIDKDAPPGINSREFNSIIRVRDQDLIVLGGLEEKVKNDSGTGVPLISRIPIIKWFFSSRKREDSKKKLTVLIKPTVIY